MMGKEVRNDNDGQDIRLDIRGFWRGCLGGCGGLWSLVALVHGGSMRGDGVDAVPRG